MHYGRWAISLKGLPDGSLDGHRAPNILCIINIRRRHANLWFLERIWKRRIRRGLKLRLLELKVLRIPGVIMHPEQ